MESYSQSPKSPSEPLANQGVKFVKTVLGRKPCDLSLEQIDAVTWKVTDGTKMRTWSGDRSGEYLTTKGVAYIINIGGGDWIIRIGKRQRSRVMTLAKAKRYVFEALRGQRPLIEMDDPLRELDKLYADHLDREALAAEPKAEFPYIGQRNPARKGQ